MKINYSSTQKFEGHLMTFMFVSMIHLYSHCHHKKLVTFKYTTLVLNCIFDSLQAYPYNNIVRRDWIPVLKINCDYSLTKFPFLTKVQPNGKSGVQRYIRPIF